MEKKFSGDVPLARNYRVRVENESEVKEERVFGKKEIFDIIRRVAILEGIDAKNLQAENEVYDRDGHLISFSVAVTPSEAVKFGKGEICFDFMIKGNHGKVGFSSLDSSIVRIYAPLNKRGEYDEGGIVAEYKDGVWKLSPGSMLPTVTDVRKN